MKNENVKAPLGADTFDGSTGIICSYHHTDHMSLYILLELVNKLKR